MELLLIISLPCTSFSTSPPCAGASTAATASASFVTSQGGRNVRFCALHGDVPRRLHRGSERRARQSGRRRLHALARVVHWSTRGVRPAVRTSLGVVRRGDGRAWGGAGGSAHGGTSRSLGR